MRATILPWAIILTKAHRVAVSMMAEYCGLSTVSNVFLIFTTPLHSCLCKYNDSCYQQS